jgi:hypothetical protein
MVPTRQGELWHRALQDRLAEVDIGKHAVQRITMIVIGRGGEERLSRFRPVFRCGDRQILF